MSAVSRWLALLGASVALTFSVAATPAGAHAPAGPGTDASGEPIGLGVCDMSVAVVRDSAKRLRPLVPAGYSLGKSLYTLGLAPFASVVSWTMDCDAIAVQGRRPMAGRLSFVGIQIEAPGRPTSGATIANEFDIYTLFAASDRRVLARRLRAGGMPARFVPGMEMERSRGVAITVPARTSPYALQLAPLHPDPVGVHRHANGFWHEGAGGRAARVSLDIPSAVDTTCILLVGVCGAIEAPAGTPVAELLGASHRHADFVFDHVDLTGATLAVEPQGAQP